MLFAHSYSRTRTVGADLSLTVENLQRFRASVILALAAADGVVLDLRRTTIVDSWALLELSDLAATFAPRLSFAASDEVCAIIERLTPHARGASKIGV